MTAKPAYRDILHSQWIIPSSIPKSPILRKLDARFFFFFLLEVPDSIIYVTVLTSA